MVKDVGYYEAEKKIEQARRKRTTELYLSSMKLTKLPGSIGNLTALQKLYLRKNQLSALPQSIGNLTALQTLDLSENQLSNLPQRFGNLTALQELYLFNNQLSSLPGNIGNLTALQELLLDGNQLSNLPEIIGNLTALKKLNLRNNPLSSLPESIGNLTALQELYLFTNKLSSLPESIGNLTALQILRLDENQLSSLPESIGNLTALQKLYLFTNQLRNLPENIANLTALQELRLDGNQLSRLPESIGNLTALKELNLRNNQLRALPESIGNLTSLQTLYLDYNPLNVELNTAHKQGFNALMEYLRAQGEAQIVLNEAKLVLVGEGGVGKTSLLAALKGEDWVENRTSTHGVEVDIQPITLETMDGTTITLNGWDFGGQNIYRHTHQLFFTSPAVYLVVWDPRRGPEQCCVAEWIKMVKHRAYDEQQPQDRPRVLVVATHGGPKERLAHIDEQALRDEFGELIVGFYHIDSKPDKNSERFGIEELKAAITKTAADIPQVGRAVPASWKRVLDAIRTRSETDPYISYAEFETICSEQEVNSELAGLYAVILNELGYLIHYRTDSQLKDTVILKPEWLSKAISFILEDRKVKDQNGLVHHHHLHEIWNDPARPESDRYPEKLHDIFLRLMERFDLSYQVAMPQQDAPETSLVAQLVPGKRPDGWESVWQAQPNEDDAERTQICRIIDAETGRTAEVEGLLYRLIVRLHRFSLGKSNYEESVHWKNGMVLDDNYNGRAFIEDIAGDIRITVRAAYPERFLHLLCDEVKWLVDHFWKGLDCRVSVPCHPPCKGVFELRQLIKTKQKGYPEILCGVCGAFQIIDSLLATAAPIPAYPTALEEIKVAKQEIMRGMETGFASVNADLRRLISQADEQFYKLMNTLTDPAKDGPRLFSFESVDPGFLDKPTWLAERFRLTLWCEHSRLPLPLLTGDEKCGVYELEISREWVQKSAPFLKILFQTLSLTLPVASSATKLVMNDDAYKGIEKQLDFGQKCADSFLKGGEKIINVLSDDDKEYDFDHDRAGSGRYARGSTLRELHALLKEKDKTATFGGLERVQNKRREFLWVHPQFIDQY